MFECLDVAAVTTLANMQMIDVSNTGPQASDVLDAMNSTGRIFGASETCDGRTVGDGRINSYDLTVLLWVQFGVQPYAAALAAHAWTLDGDANLGPYPDATSQHGMTPNFGTVASWGSFPTVQGRESTSSRCGTRMPSSEYAVELADDFCNAGLPMAMSQPDGLLAPPFMPASPRAPPLPKSPLPPPAPPAAPAIIGSWDMMDQWAGTGEGAEAGSAIDVSSDGKWLVVGMPGVNDGVGQVVLYRFNDFWETVLTLRGSQYCASSATFKSKEGDETPCPLTSQAGKCRFGASVSLSGDGLTLAVGAPHHGCESAFSRFGMAQIFRIATDESSGQVQSAVQR